MNDLILPLFVCDGENDDNPLSPVGCCRYSLDELTKVVAKAEKRGIKAIATLSSPGGERKDLHSPKAAITMDCRNDASNTPQHLISQ
ncbi:MAG: hypothetical protein R2827_02940 [Bdellovibrionales bacterium]